MFIVFCGICQLVIFCHSNPPIFWVGAGAAELNTLAGKSLPPFFLPHPGYKFLVCLQIFI